MSTWLLPRSELTSEQLRAVELSPQCHQVIFGAPGSGKTQILLHRAAFLRSHLGTKPNCFRIFVYTNVLKHYIRSALALLNLPEDAVTTYDDWCRVFYRKNAVKPCTLGQGYKAHAVLSSQTCDKIAV
jgi:superfamily I DNA/RNA helicase